MELPFFIHEGYATHSSTIISQIAYDEDIALSGLNIFNSYDGLDIIGADGMAIHCIGQDILLAYPRGIINQNTASGNGLVGSAIDSVYGAVGCAVYIVLCDAKAQ